MKRILIYSYIQDSIDSYDRGVFGSRSCWGIIELRRKYSSKIKKLRNIIWNSFSFIFDYSDVVYLHDLNTSVKKFLPLPILKFFTKKKVVALSHSHIYGTGISVDMVSSLKKRYIDFF